MSARKATDGPVRVAVHDLERAAHILGPHSAAQQALADIRRRQEAGEEPAVYLCAGTYFVGPEIEALPNSGEPT